MLLASARLKLLQNTLYITLSPLHGSTPKNKSLPSLDKVRDIHSLRSSLHEGWFLRNIYDYLFRSESSLSKLRDAIRAGRLLQYSDGASIGVPGRSLAWKAR